MLSIIVPCYNEEKTIPLPQTHKEGDRLHIVHWDGKNSDYEYVESGVYIWIIREDDGSKYDGKVVVVRQYKNYKIKKQLTFIQFLYKIL